MRRLQTHATGSDETAPYIIYDYQAKTAADFVQEVLQEEPHEWGYIQVGGQRVEYRYGELLTEVPHNWKNITITSVKGVGGWSQMDYYLNK